MKKAFNEVFEDCTKYGTKIKTDEYHAFGTHIIIDQGQEQIAGYTDMEDGLFTDIPAIVFGDHTRVIKYVDKPFFLGADGVKVLRCKYSNANYKYLYYALKNAKIPDTGYNRHFKWLKETQIPFPDIASQANIVHILDSVIGVIKLRQQQLSALDDLIKARFVEMFDNKYPTVVLRDVIKTTSGGTPSKAHPEYYDGGTIPWLSSGEINAGVITSVKNYITEEGMRKSSAKMIPKDSVVVAMYGATAGVTGILKIETTTNQAVCSLLPTQQFIPEYLYYAVASKKDWMISQCQGGGQPNISQGIIKSMELIDAPLHEQGKFAEFVQQVDKTKAAVQKAFDEHHLLFDSLMQHFFGDIPF